MRKLKVLHLSLLTWVLTVPVQPQCSDGRVTFKAYSRIEYSDLARAGRLEANVKGTLLVSAGGNAGSALTLRNVAFLQKDGQQFTKTPVKMLFQEPIERAMASWRLVNETGKELSLPLVVEYRLEGAVFGPDLEQKNMVMFKDGGLIIRVIAGAAEVQPRGTPSNP